LRYQNGYRKTKNLYFYGMFISRKKNRSGSTSVVVISKVSGKLKYLKTIGISFVAYKMYKELDRVLNLSGINLSADKALAIAKTITTLKIKLPLQNKSIYHTLLLSKQHNQLKLLYNEKYWQSIEKI